MEIAHNDDLPRVILLHLHSTIYIQLFHRLFLCLPSPYGVVIIRLPTKQYYLFVYFLEFSMRVLPKLITEYVIDFFKTYRFQKYECIGMLMRVIIKYRKMFTYTFYIEQISNKFSGYVRTQKSKCDNHAITDTLSTFWSLLTNQRQE